MTRILVVEDDVTTARMLVDFFADSGYQVVWEPDGLRALLHIDLRKPDAIVLDLMLPVITGVDVARRLRNDLRSAHIPILAITGIESLADFSEVLMVDRVISKPVDLNELGESLSQLLGTSPDAGLIDQRADGFVFD